VFGMAGETEFDLRFQLFNIPVRVHPMFWLSSAFMVWDGENPVRTFLGVLCLFISVLVHELGHAVVIRRFGFSSEIVLYLFCGYATSSHFPFRKAIAVSVAGPAAGLLLGALVYMVGRFGLLGSFAGFSEVFYFWQMMIFAGLIVNLLNLVPCLPLDGGQIMAALVRQFGPRGRDNSELILRISIAVSGAVALWAAWCSNHNQPFFPVWMFLMLPAKDGRLLFTLQPDPSFEVFFMGYLCATSIIELNRYRAWR
jgi:stage IV sporulation protein FB